MVVRTEATDAAFIGLEFKGLQNPLFKSVSDDGCITSWHYPEHRETCSRVGFAVWYRKCIVLRFWC